MANILTAAEAANVLKVESTDSRMLDLLPGIDAYIRQATGRDWTTDSSISPLAKSAARILLAQWYENPGMTANGQTALDYGLRACLTQLEALALRYREVQGRNGAGACALEGAEIGDSVTSVTGLIGVSGSQVGVFETVISVNDEIQQASSSDLSANWYRVCLTPPEAL